MMLPTIQYLHECFILDPEQGKLFWRERPFSHFPSRKVALNHHARFAGKEAGNFSARAKGGVYSQVVLTVEGVKLRIGLQRIIFAMSEDAWPAPGLVVDHIDGDTTNNRPSNLRAIPQAENCRNAAMPRDNTSGHVGVHWDQQRGKWCATICRDGRTSALGRFDDLANAVAARREAERALGFHPNHGRNDTERFEVTV